MSDALSIQRQARGDVMVVTLQGNVTEDSTIDELKKDLKPIVIFNLEKVQRINSYGIRQWVNVMKEIRKEVQHLIFHRCPPIIVEQFNMINNFGAGGLVYSIYMPYSCENCGKDELRLYTLPDGKSPDQTAAVPSLTCSACSKPLTFNDIEEEYFYFLQHQKGQSVPASALDLLKSGS